MAGKLFVVGTPIGNLSDLSPRACQALEQCDFIAAEDTRVSVKILNHLGIKKPMISYYEHNKLEKGDIICDRIAQGENCCIVTDAGMPCISDPGELLVKQCHDRGIIVTVVPGPSAVVSALAISGLETGRFTFEGFLSTNKKSRKDHLDELKNEKRTMIFYEAPHKLKSTLDDMYKAFGDREISLVRELTKVHEEVIRTTLSNAIDYYKENIVKGEFVLVLKGAEKSSDEIVYTIEMAVEMANDYINQGMSKSDASKKVATETKFKKGDIYKQLI